MAIKRLKSKPGKQRRRRKSTLTQRSPSPDSPLVHVMSVADRPLPKESEGRIILIDDRAGSQNLVEHFPLNKLGALTRLDAGDVFISGNGPEGIGTVLVGVEVKSISDFLSSISTGRLQATQIPMMRKLYDVCYVLVYGMWRASTHDGALQVQGRNGQWRNYHIGSRGVPYGYPVAMMHTLAAAGIRVVRVGDVEEAAEWIGGLDRWWAKPWGKHKGLRTFDTSGNGKRRRNGGSGGEGELEIALPVTDAVTDLMTRIAKEFPGVGYERARLIAKSFESPLEMLTAEWERLAEIHGVGKVIAKAFVNAVSERKIRRRETRHE